MTKYELVEAIETEDPKSERNIQIMMINSLLYIAEELAESNKIQEKLLLEKL